MVSLSIPYLVMIAEPALPSAIVQEYNGNSKKWTEFGSSDCADAKHMVTRQLETLSMAKIRGKELNKKKKK